VQNAAFIKSGDSAHVGTNGSNTKPMAPRFECYPKSVRVPSPQISQPGGEVGFQFKGTAHNAAYVQGTLTTRRAFRVLFSSKVGTSKTVKARFRPWLSGKSPEHHFSRTLFSRKLRGCSH